MRPRESADSPAAARSSWSVWPCRPAEYITVSAGIRFPEDSVVIVPASFASTEATSSPRRNCTARSRRWNLRDSTTSGSQNSSSAGRLSTTVTRVPRAANIDAYSIPITPAPATSMELGTRSRSMTPSESTTRGPNSTASGRAGDVPVAMTKFADVITELPPPPSAVTATVCGSVKRAHPLMRSTWLRISWARTTSTSRPMTCWVRASRSCTVMSALTR